MMIFSLTLKEQCVCSRRMTSSSGCLSVNLSYLVEHAFVSFFYDDVIAFLSLDYLGCQKLGIDVIANGRVFD